MSNEIENYDITEHIHRFAVWTAARAAQRGFTTTENIVKAINKTELSNLINDTKSAIYDFDNFHRNCAEQLIKSLQENYDKNGAPLLVSYGRVSKIIAIYIKTAVVLPNKGSCDLSKIAHPPIDRILLSKLSKLKNADFEFQNWTTLDENTYFDIIKKIRNFSKIQGLEGLWKIENYWRPTD
jgi:hypothetical protein